MAPIKINNGGDSDEGGAEAPSGTPLPGIATPPFGPTEITHLRSGVKRLTASVEMTQAPWTLVDELTSDLRAEEKDLFIRAYTDRLTGLLNRTGLNFCKEIIGTGRILSMAFLDGDHFKALNTLGESFGDRCIGMVGKNLALACARMRSLGHDVYALRKGGEEFIIFGDVTKEQLSEELERTAAAIKSEIRSEISAEDMERMAYEIFKGKYSNDTEHGLDRARSEIGGITAGVCTYHFGKGVNPNRATRNSVTCTEELAESKKVLGGRGVIHKDPRSTTDATFEALSPEPNNNLTRHERIALTRFGRELNRTVRLQFTQRTPLMAELLKNVDPDSQLYQDLKYFFTIPPFIMTQAKQLADKVGVGVGNLRMAKIELMHAQHDYGTYSGAATMLHLEALDNSFTEPRQIELGEFKSINETMGHTNGDIWLTWFYQNIVLDAAARCNLQPDSLVIAQKGSRFIYRAKEGVSTDAFEDMIAKLYTEKLPELQAHISGNDSDSLNEYRREWIRYNKKSTLEESLGNLNTLFFKKYTQ